MPKKNEMKNITLKLIHTMYLGISVTIKCEDWAPILKYMKIT